MKHKSEMPAQRFQRHHIILSIVAIVVCLTAGIAFAVAAHRRGRFIRPFWERRRG